jgi:hypothetical protein
LAIQQKPNVKLKIINLRKRNENPTQPNTTQIQLIENLNF